MGNDDDYGEIIPPRGTARRAYNSDHALVEAGRTIPEGWGFGNIVEALRNRSAARLATARRHKVEEWERFLSALNNLGRAMKEYERTRRMLENLDSILDEEEKHERTLTDVIRKTEILDARTNLALAEKRHREAAQANTRNAATEQKEQPQRTSPEERIRQKINRRKELREACDKYIAEILEAARASGNEDSPEVKREIENVKSDFDKEIAKTYEKS